MIHIPVELQEKCKKSLKILGVTKYENYKSCQNIYVEINSKLFFELTLTKLRVEDKEVILEDISDRPLIIPIPSHEFDKFLEETTGGYLVLEGKTLRQQLSLESSGELKLKYFTAKEEKFDLWNYLYSLGEPSYFYNNLAKNYVNCNKLLENL
jgi:hypothetical protein